jgi:hypothetical protein
MRIAWKQKGYSLINILGLAAGIACCLIILLYVRDELAYDSLQIHADRLYRLNKVVTIEGSGTEGHAITSGMSEKKIVVKTEFQWNGSQFLRERLSSADERDH